MIDKKSKTRMNVLFHISFFYNFVKENYSNTDLYGYGSLYRTLSKINVSVRKCALPGVKQCKYNTCCHRINNPNTGCQR